MEGREKQRNKGSQGVKISFHQRANSGPRPKNCKSPRDYLGKFKPRCRRQEVILHYDLLLRKNHHMPQDAAGSPSTGHASIT